MKVFIIFILLSIAVGFTSDLFINFHKKRILDNKRISGSHKKVTNQQRHEKVPKVLPATFAVNFLKAFAKSLNN